MRSGSQVALLVAANLFVGAMVGVERSTLPLVAERDFGLASTAAALSFLVAFGLAKATFNLLAGAAADRLGRRRLLLAGWLLALPVPLVILWAPSWGWVVAANALLGASQALCWSMTLNMKLDLAPPHRRGLVAGLNEAAGYLGVALAAFLAAVAAARVGHREAAAFVGLAVALAGLGLALLARETHAPQAGPTRVRLGGDRRLVGASVAGLATNLKDGVLWGLLPLALAAGDALQGAVVVAAYPLVWALGQLATGPLSDRGGRRGLALGGLALQAAGVALFFADAFPLRLAAAGLAGVGTALAYPTLLAYVADHAPEGGRAGALGTYRFWRDAGYAAGALAGGLAADAVGLRGAFLATAGLVAAAAALAAVLTAPQPVAKGS